MNEISTSSATLPFPQLLVVTESRQSLAEEYFCRAYTAPVCGVGAWGQYHHSHGLNDMENPLLLSAFSKFTLPGVIGYSSSITAEVEHVLRQIGGLVEIPRPAEIREYLLRFPDMLSILPCICFHVAIEFGVNAQISLELFKDRESADRYLALYVRQDTYAKNIMKQLEKIWLNFEPEIAERKGWINITTDYRSPH